MKILKSWKAHIMIGLFLLSGLIYFGGRPAFAATKVQIQSVDYYNENIIITNGTNNGTNTKFYFATDTDAANDNWDVLPADTGTTTTMDISWVPQTTEGVILIKGDVDVDPVRIVIKAKPTKLNISVNYTNMSALPASSSIAPLLNIQSTEGTAANPININDLEWKKDESGQWSSTSSLTVGLLNKYLIKGTYLYFRIKAVNDVANAPYYPDGTLGRRFSDEVKVKISKQASAMVYGINGSKFTADIRYGKEYKVTATYPAKGVAAPVVGYSDWIRVTDRSTDPISLATLVNNVTPRNYDTSNNLITYNGETVAFPKMFIEIRSYATRTSSSSKTTEIPLNAQRTISEPIQGGVPAADAIQNSDDNVYVAYNGGNKFLTITIPTASTTLPYEYCIVKPGYQFDLAHTSWTSITKGTGIKVLATKAVDGGKLYIRMKEIKSKAATAVSGAVDYALASTYVSHDINYPSVPAPTKTNLTYVKGYPSPLEITATLNVSGKDAYETDVLSVKLGTRSIGFTTVPTTLPGNVKTLKITLNGDDVKTLTNCSNRVLTITYANKTTDKTSKLTVKNPTPAGALLVSAAKGTTGKTAVTVGNSLGSGNTWVYIITTQQVTGKNMEDTIAKNDYHTYIPGTDITVQANSYLTMYEIKTDSMTNPTSNISNIINYGSIQITADMIGA